MELEYVTDMSGYRPPQSLNEPKLQSATVLVVEDEADSREVFTHYLVWRGYRVFAVADSKDALDTLECEPSIGIVLLDLMMPGTGGLETMKAILERRPEVGVIMMSALYDNEVAALAVNRGAYDYLLKPFPLDLLDEVITACLTHNESRKRPWWRRIG
jgi:DNA-binding NtrC family response regulator